MTSENKIVERILKHIEKNLRGKTPFRNTSDFLAYIHKKESEKNNQKTI